MSRIFRLLALTVALGSILFGSAAYSQPGEAENRTLSPYFFVKSDDPEVDRLPLKSAGAAVDISGVIADVKVIQVYQNQSPGPLEAVYVFPASTRASVYGMKMTIGERVIEARISKREEARREYEQAKQQGKSASLLEQQRPNVFQMNVANIMPGEEIKVELKYTELLVPADRVYEFVYPTVVGPRYFHIPEGTVRPSEGWIQNPYLHEGEAPPYAFDIQVGISAGLPIKELRCTSHKVTINFDGPSVARLRLDNSEVLGGNRDYILRYSLEGEKIQSGLLLYQGERENFFLLMTQPPRRVTDRDIPGREYIFIVDVSGSMHGFPLEISKKLLQDLIGHLRPTDRFNVLLFAGGSSVMAEESLPATQENIQKALHLIGRQRGGGGTELLPALRRALELHKPEGYSRTVVIATDGYVTVEEEVFAMIRRHLGNANMFPFGIGTAVNRHIIEGMARVGMGEPFIITQPGDAPFQARRFRSLIQSPVLTQVRVKFEGFGVYDVEPPGIPDVLAERPVIVFGKWRGLPAGRITLSGIAGNGVYREVVEVQKVEPSATNSALPYLWARHRIALLSDFNRLRPLDLRRKQVTDLGLTYNLLTAYTSFVVVDTEVRNPEGRQTTVKQPLPLPLGVSDYAVGALKSAQTPAGPLLARGQAVASSEDKALREKRVHREEGKTTISLGEVILSPNLPRDSILPFIQKRIHDLGKCSQETEPGGPLVVELTVSPDGKVKNAKIISSPWRNERPGKCVLTQVRKWQFPSAGIVREARMTVTFHFG